MVDIALSLIRRMYRTYVNLHFDETQDTSAYTTYLPSNLIDKRSNTNIKVNAAINKVT